jgi:dephospho-CoA kinase
MTRRRTLHNDADATLLLDIPLLVESGYENLGGIIVVDVDPEIAGARLGAQRGFSEDDARLRISRQASRAERLARADFVVENEGDLDELRQRVDECWAWIMAHPRPEPGGPVVPIRSRGAN